MNDMMLSFGKKIVVLLVLISAIFLVTKTIKALDTASVAATVTVQNISVAVADGTISYGTLSVGTTKSTADIPDIQVATNDGNVAETFNISGSNSANWTLATAPGVNTYAHKLSIGTTAALTTGYTTMQTNVGVGLTKAFNLILFTPTSSTNYTSQSVNVTVQAVAY